MPRSTPARRGYRRALAGELRRIASARAAGGHLPEQDAALAAPRLVGALIEGLIGPLAPDPGGDPVKARAHGAGADAVGAARARRGRCARARGLVVQTRCALRWRGDEL